MLTAKELLDAAKTAQGGLSNYRMARLIDCPEKTVARWSANQTAPGDKYAHRLAELSGIDLAVVLASMRAQSAKEAHEKAVWSDIAERLRATIGTTGFGGLTAFILSLFCFFGGPPDGGAHAATPGEPSISAPTEQRHAVYYVKSVAAYLIQIQRFLIVAIEQLIPANPSIEGYSWVGA